MPREITFDIATQYSNGYYNPTINWGIIQNALNFLGRYWDVSYRRTNSGRVHFVQANTQPNPDWMMWTRGWTTYVSPTRNFGNNNYQAARYWCHEHMHQVSGGQHVGGNDALMSIYGGISPNLTPLDYPYMDKYPRKPGAKRPHEEPTAFRDAFATFAGAATYEDHESKLAHWEDEVLPSFGMSLGSESQLPKMCNCKPTLVQKLLHNWVP